MVRVLAVADEPVEWLWSPAVRRVGADLIVGCGDLPAAYLEYLVTVGGVPLVYVPGNHDPDAHAGAGPGGCENVDGRVVECCGLRVAGLGGSLRYRDGPNQYTEREMRRRARRLARRAAPRVVVLVTHAPPAGLGDGDDPPHHGFAAFVELLDAVRPQVMVHGHVVAYGPRRPDPRHHGIPIVNAIPHRVIELPGG